MLHTDWDMMDSNRFDGSSAAKDIFGNDDFEKRIQMLQAGTAPFGPVVTPASSVGSAVEDDRRASGPYGSANWRRDHIAASCLDTPSSSASVPFGRSLRSNGSGGYGMLQDNALDSSLDRSLNSSSQSGSHFGEFSQDNRIRNLHISSQNSFTNHHQARNNFSGEPTYQEYGLNQPQWNRMSLGDGIPGGGHALPMPLQPTRITSIPVKMDLGQGFDSPREEVSTSGHDRQLPRPPGFERNQWKYSSSFRENFAVTKHHLSNLPGNTNAGSQWDSETGRMGTNGYQHGSVERNMNGQMKRQCTGNSVGRSSSFTNNSSHKLRPAVNFSEHRLKILLQRSDAELDSLIKIRDKLLGFRSSSSHNKNADDTNYLRNSGKAKDQLSSFVIKFNDALKTIKTELKRLSGSSNDDFATAHELEWTSTTSGRRPSSAVNGDSATYESKAQLKFIHEALDVVKALRTQTDWIRRGMTMSMIGTSESVVSLFETLFLNWDSQKSSLAYLVNQIVKDNHGPAVQPQQLSPSNEPVLPDWFKQEDNLNLLRFPPNRKQRLPLELTGEGRRNKVQLKR